MNTRTDNQRTSITVDTTSSAGVGAGHPEEVHAPVQPWKCRYRAPGKSSLSALRQSRPLARNVLNPEPTVRR